MCISSVTVSEHASYLRAQRPPGSFTGVASPVKSRKSIQGAFSHFAFAHRLPHDPNRCRALPGVEALWTARLSSRTHGTIWLFAIGIPSRRFGRVTMQRHSRH